MKRYLSSSGRWRSNAAQRVGWVKRFGQSGLTQREFAKRHQIGLSTLARWLAQHRAQAGNGVFTEVKLPSGSGRWAAEIVRRDGTVLRLAHDAPALLLEQLLPVC